MLSFFMRVFRESGYLFRENLYRETRIHFRLGKKLLKELNYKGAEMEFRQVLRFDPSHFRAHVCLAKIYKHIENFTEALKELTIAFRLNPKRYESYRLDKDHEELLHQSKGGNSHLTIPLKWKKCASNLSEAAKRMHTALSKQQKLIDNISKLERSITDRKDKSDKNQRDDSRIESVEKMIEELWTSREKSSKKQDPIKKTSNAGPYGDFSGADEFKKFQKMPPITREEIDETDWDELLDEDC